MGIAEILGSRMYAQEGNNQALAHDGGDPPKLLTPVETIQIQDVNLVVTSRDILGDGIWGIGFGNGVDNNGMYGDLGYVWNGTYSNSPVEIIRRMWNWSNSSELSLGTTENIDISNGDIRLN